jgi:hypothetical protein
MYRLSAIALALIVAAAVTYATSGQKQAPTPATVAIPAAEKPKAAATPSSSAPRFDKSKATQVKRQQLIQRLVNERVFTKVGSPGNLPRVWVGPRFYSVDFDTKQQFISVVYAYAFDEVDIGNLVRVFDGRTNKEIGTYDESTGLHLD